MTYHFAIFQDLPESYIKYYNEEHNLIPEGELMDISRHEPTPKYRSYQNV